MHQSWVSVATHTDDSNVITRTQATYDFLCDTAIIVNNIVQGALMTKTKHCDCAPLLNYFINILLRYEIK